MPAQGALAPHAAWSGKGVQAQINTLDLDVDEVVSHFNPEIEQSKVLLYGSNITEILPNTAKSEFNSNQVFNISREIDALGDIYVEMEFDSQEGSDIPLSEFSLHRTLDKVEFKIGNTNWQTLEHADLYSLLFTKLSSSEYISVRNITDPETGEPVYTNLGPILKANKKSLISFPLPLFTMEGGASRAHLITGSFNQSITIKLTYRKPTELNLKTVTLSSVKLYARQYILTNKERDAIKQNDVVKSIHTSQGTIKHDEPQIDNTNTKIVNVELDNFSILASHLLITMESQDGDAIATTTNAFTPNILSAQLQLNNSDHSSPLSGHFMKNLGAKSMGLYNNTEYANLSLASSFTSTTQKEYRRDVYVFPLASRPYGTDGCPLNRFNTINLKLEIKNFPGRVNVTAVGVTSALYSKGKASLLYFS